MHQKLFIALSILFVVSHIVLSINSLRSTLITKLGEKAFAGIFLLCSLATLGGAILLYVKYDVQGPELWKLTPPLVAMIYILMLGSFLFLFLSFDNPSPIGNVPAKIVEPAGILRITGHPQNMGIALFCISHALASMTMGGIILYGSIALLGIIGAFHQNYNKSLDKDPAVQDFLNKTSVVPFWAILRGRNKLVLSELKIKFIGIALAAFIFSVFIHKIIK